MEMPRRMCAPKCQTWPHRCLYLSTETWEKPTYLFSQRVHSGLAVPGDRIDGFHINTVAQTVFVSLPFEAHADVSAWGTVSRQEAPWSGLWTLLHTHNSALAKG